MHSPLADEGSNPAQAQPCAKPGADAINPCGSAVLGSQIVESSLVTYDKILTNTGKTQILASFVTETS